MSDQTYNITQEDLRKEESKASTAHGGNVPKDSNVAALQSIVDTADKSKSQIIDERKANLPLPDQPPVASDWNSADATNVNVGSGGTEGGISYGNDALRDPATGDSAVRTDGAAYGVATQGQGVGREAAEGLGGIPNDAVARDAKNKTGLVDTTGPDYGYPQKNDPSSAK